VAVDSTFATVMSLGAGGALLGVLLAARCLRKAAWEYKRDAKTIPSEEVIWRLALIATPVSKAVYAFVATAIIAGRHAPVPAWLPWAAGGALAFVAIVQGAVASALGDSDRSGFWVGTVDAFVARFPNKARPNDSRLSLSLAVLGVIETLAILTLVVTIVLLPRLANV